MRKITLLFIVCVCVCGMGMTVSAQLPSGNYYVPNDPGNGSAFYATLTDAFTAINDNGLGGDITLYVNGNIEQTTNVGLINPSDHIITIRPVDDNDYTITFSHATDDNAGPSGSMVIGIKMSLAWADLVSTKNIVIDGYANGGTTRRLKFATSATHHGGNPPFVIVNDCSNITIKNTIIEHVGATTGTSGYGIYLRANTAYGTNKMPSDILIENNHITANKNGAYQGIGFFANAAPALSATGVKIKDNVIVARTRGIFLNYVNGIEISGNEFFVKQTNASTLSSGIMGNGGLSGDIIISDNKFTELNSYNSATGAWGMRGIIASGGGTWYIDNNFFSGLEKGYGAGESMLQYIRTGSTCLIRHNTFYLKSLSYKPTDNIDNPNETQGAYCAINIAAGTPVIKNNIFISNENEVYNLFIRGTNGGDSDYNLFYFENDNTKARINATYTTLADYQTGSDKDANSISKAVSFVSATDLSLTGTSIGDLDLAVPALAEITTDIFENARHTPNVYMGAHEASDLNSVTPPTTKTFTVTVPQGTEKVYIAGSFPDKDWDINDPYELTATENPNEFTGTFPCGNDIEYKYLSDKGDWEYQEASSLGSTEFNSTDPSPVKPSDGTNRTYNEADEVTNWVAISKLVLTAKVISGATPTDLYVKGGWDGWSNSTALTKSGSDFTVTFGGNAGDKFYSNTGYKYYTTNSGTPENWESRDSNRRAIYPTMLDEISEFNTTLPLTGLDNTESGIHILRSSTGITVTFDGAANIELYNLNGVLIEKTTASASYSRDLPNGAYIIRINGQSIKFVK